MANSSYSSFLWSPYKLYRIDITYTNINSWLLLLACAKSPQLCLILWDPMDCSPPGSSVHGILLARILELLPLPFSRGSSHPRDQTQDSCTAGRFFTNCLTREACSVQFSAVAHDVRFFATPGIAAHQASLSIINSWSLLKLMCIKSVMPSSHLILCRPLLLLPPIPPSSFPMSQLFAWGGQSIGVSALASVLPMNTQDWSPLGWTGWISMQSKGLSRVFSITTVQKHQFFGAQLSSQSNSHIHAWPLEKP